MILTMSRPAKLQSDPIALDNEYRSARWVHHRLLDFEDEHQRLLDTTAEAIAPGIVRVGRILARLARRERRRQRSSPGTWSPNPRPELAERLKVLLGELRKVRNADPRWRTALAWADELTGGPKSVRRRRAKDPSKLKRKKNETDESWAKRFALFTTDETDEHYAEKVAAAKRRTRREEYRAQLYSQRRCYWATWNAMCRSVDQARADVLKRRKLGLPAEWHHPRFGDSVTLATDAGGLRIIDRSGLWWVADLRIGLGEEEWARVQFKGGNWHHVPDEAIFTTAKLTRRRDGQRWSYSLSITVEGVTKPRRASSAATIAPTGTVAFDWGHREHGHDNADEGLRAFVWRGSDGRTGEILVPTECRQMLDEIDALKTRLDVVFNARRKEHCLPDRNRHGYRKRLLRSGVRTSEQADWLRWEMRYERRISRCRKRFQNIRREQYVMAVRELSATYATFAFEDERVHDPLKKRRTIRELQTDEMRRHRQRANRDLCARYEFISICERFAGHMITVSARNTTRECPDCGHLDENTAELLMGCSGCGTVRDKDHGSTRVILRRAEQALAISPAE